MKKYFIIAIAALAAGTACSKVETVEAPDQAIAFQVVDYSTATRAENSLRTEGYDSFKTWAWIHADGAAQGSPFMKGVTVAYSTANKEWAPTPTYFWPKNSASYINFFSIAGTELEPTVAEGSVTYTGKEIDTEDNILIADAAYRYSTNPDAKYGFDEVQKGVPTLFHHMLSRVKFDVVLDASGVTDPKYKFTATISKAEVTYANKGNLTITFTDPNSTGQASIPTTANWTDQTGNGKIEKAAGDITLDVTANTAGNAKSTVKDLIAEKTVLPQTLGTLADNTVDPAVAATGNVKFNLTYKIKTEYGTSGTDEYVTYEETLNFADVLLTAFNDAITSWDMNYKYTYHITIKAVGGEKILFDPAVVTWETATNEPSYTVPTE